MEIEYIVEMSDSSLNLSFGCFTQCNVNVNYGNDTWCGLNNCRQEQNLLASTNE